MWHLGKIPRTAHFYWGNDTISFLRYLAVYSFKKFNPDWLVKIYYPQMRYRGQKTWHTLERYNEFSGENYRDRLLALDTEKVEVDFTRLNFGHNVPENYKGDFLRWKILSTEGGLFSDIDILYFRPMDSLYFNHKSNRNVDTVVCLNEKEGPYHSVGFLLSSQENEYYKFIHNASYSVLNFHNYQCMGPMIPNSCFPTLSSIQNKFEDINVFNMKMEVVYPLYDFRMTFIYHGKDLSCISEDTVGLHWYAGHPEAGRLENEITENNYKNYDNVLGQIISKVLGGGRPE